MEKEYLRNRYIKIRESVENKDIKSKVITEEILNLKEYKQAKIVCLYANLEFEVDTKSLINHGIMNGKTIGVPKVINKNMIEFYKINSEEELKVIGLFGIKEPIGEKKALIEKDSIDLIIIPGICFDRNKNRIGFGKGYYDRYLSNISEDIVKLGICFDEQLIDDGYIEATVNDIKMDLIITDTEKL